MVGNTGHLSDLTLKVQGQSQLLLSVLESGWGVGCIIYLHPLAKQKPESTADSAILTEVCSLEKFHGCFKDSKVREQLDQF